MRVSTDELRAMVTEAVRRVITGRRSLSEAPWDLGHTGLVPDAGGSEAPAPTTSATGRKGGRPKRVTAARSEESVLADRERKVRGLPGHSHGGDGELDMARPLGRKNRLKLQGAAGMGGWTSEGRMTEEAVRAIVREIVVQEFRVRRGR